MWCGLHCHPSFRSDSYLTRPGARLAARLRSHARLLLVPFYRLRRNRIRRTTCSPFSVRSVLIVTEAESLSSCSTTYPGEARLSTSAQPPRRQDLTSSRTLPCAALPSSAVLNP